MSRSVRYMSAAEVREIMKRAWAANGSILGLIYTTRARLAAKRAQQRGRASGLGSLVRACGGPCWLWGLHGGPAGHRHRVLRVQLN